MILECHQARADAWDGLEAASMAFGLSHTEPLLSRYGGARGQGGWVLKILLLLLVLRLEGLKSRWPISAAQGVARLPRGPT